MKTALTCFFLAICAVGTRAQESAEEQWSKLSEAQKNEIRANYRRYQAMSPEKKQQFDANYERFRVLDPKEKARVIDNYHKFKQLPASKQKQLRKKLSQLQKSKKAVPAHPPKGIKKDSRRTRSR